MQARGNEYLEQLSVGSDKDGVVIGLGWNFHEGNAGYRVDVNGVLHAEDAAYTLLVRSPSEFDLSDGKSTMRFRHVGDWQQWANRVVIAGSYDDPKGKQVTFDVDGKAHFPGAETDYAVGLDMIGSDYDYIYSGFLGKTWSIKRVPGGVSLYDVDLSGPDPEGTVAKKPHWQLKLLSAPAPCS